MSKLGSAAAGSCTMVAYTNNLVPTTLGVGLDNMDNDKMLNNLGTLQGMFTGHWSSVLPIQWRFLELEVSVKTSNENVCSSKPLKGQIKRFNDQIKLIWSRTEIVPKKEE